jgi:anti-sigma factor RsiW
MSAPALTPTVRQAQDYLAAVEHELADLPVDDRSALLEDLALHLDALAAEEDDRPIAVRLGPPAAYAADLRAAAGLPARGGASRATTAGLRSRLAGVLAAPVAQRLLPAAHELRRLLVELRPAWWVLRGYLLVLVPCLLERDGVRDFPVPAPLGSNELGLLLVLATVAGSVALGRRRLPRLVGVLVVLVGAVLAVLAFAIWQDASASRLTRGYESQPWMDPAPDQAIGKYPLLSRYGPVTDVLPYAADGTPLEGVLLYDQDGRPLDVGVQEWWADNCVRVLDQPRAADGVPVPFSFPQSYVLDPRGVDLYGAPLSGQCVTELPRPEVPLPVFPAPEEPGTGQPIPPPVPPAPGD